MELYVNQMRNTIHRLIYKAHHNHRYTTTRITSLIAINPERTCINYIIEASHQSPCSLSASNYRFHKGPVTLRVRPVAYHLWPKWLPTTKDHRRPWAHKKVAQPVGDQLEWLAKNCHRTVDDSRQWSVIGQQSTYVGRWISADLLPTGHQYWRQFDAHLTTIADRLQTY